MSLAPKANGGPSRVGRRRFALVTAVILAIALAPPVTGVSEGSRPRFAEVSAEWGIDFVHHHGGSGQRFMVETMVGGVVIFDYDGDGDDDVLLVDGGALPGTQGPPARTRLFRNDRSGGGPAFVDVTDRAGVAFAGYGCGGTAADYDGDGDIDLYLTAFGRDALLRNQGDGTFVDASAEAGIGDLSWSASAAFADTDLDGDLDLYVARYVDFTLDNHRFCGNEREGIRGYCHPDAYRGLPDRFYRSLGNGRFAEATNEAGFASAHEAALGVVFSDLDDDGWPDLYVANDLDPNLLFLNRHGTFEDVSLVSGTGYSATGKPEAGMGVEAADLDGDGRIDLFVTNFAREANGLYHNAGGGLFIDRRFPYGVAEPSLRFLGFGVAAIDVENDGDLDLAIANGHILDNALELSAAGTYAQRNQLMVNDGKGRFTEDLGAGLDQERVSRGLAAGDLDLDGDLDFVINNSNQPVEVYENRSTGKGGFLVVDLESRSANRDGIGARLRLTAAGRTQVRERRTASSYLSQNALGVHFGLAGEPRATLEIRWPSGKVQRFLDIEANRRVRVAEGAISVERAIAPR